LGPLEVRAGESSLPLTAAKQKAILALLLLHRGEIVSVDHLKEALWEGSPPTTATTAIQGYVSQLRRMLDSGADGGASLLVTNAPGYSLTAAPEQVDLSRFEQLAANGREALAAGASDRGAALIAEALALWRGAPLADFSYESWAQAAIARLEELRISALEDRIEADLACGRHADLVGELEALVADHPLRERLRGQLMLALYRSGRQAEALEAYQATRRTLVGELGIEPGPELQERNRLILNQDDGLAAPLQTQGIRPPIELPVPANPLIGRRNELEAIQDLFAREDVRLITLTGPGGTGKTRLALEAAAEMTNEYLDGVFWVGLAPLRDSELVLPTIGQAVGANEDLSRRLSGKQVLIVLDNVEHLVECGPALSSLLARAPRLNLLATSREPLRLAGEHEYPVPPLDEADAFALFVERARQHRPGFEPVDTVTEICRRLDGLPLALELAAARAKVLSPLQIRDRLDESLAFLTAGPRDAPRRHQTLRATIEWSYELLTEDEKKAFTCLAVFAGSFELKAAEAISDADLETLAALVDKSLLRQSQDGRFTLLETIREYARERLVASGEAEDVIDRHADYFAAFATEVELEMAAGRTGRAGSASRLEPDADNFRTALSRLFERGSNEDALRTASALTQLWVNRGLVNEGRTWLERAFERADHAPADVRAKALRRLGLISTLQGDYDRGRAVLEEALDLYRSLDSEPGVALTLMNLGYLASESGEAHRAREWLEEAIERFTNLEQEEEAVSAESVLALALAQLGEVEAAIAITERAVEFDRRIGDQMGEGVTLTNLAHLLLQHGAHESAEIAVLEGAAILIRLDERGFLPGILDLAAQTAAFQGKYERAARLLGAADRAHGEAGTTVAASEQQLLRRAVQCTREALGEEPFQVARQMGTRMSLDEATEFIFEAPAGNLD
jgi:predicted ATPase/DNA-binding SARP family transcriptional activator